MVQITPKKMVGMADIFCPEYDAAEPSKKTKKDDKIEKSSTQKSQAKGDSDNLRATKKSKLDAKSTGTESNEEDDAGTDDDADEDDAVLIEDDDQVVSSEGEADVAQDDVDDLKSDDDRRKAEEDAVGSGDESD